MDNTTTTDKLRCSTCKREQSIVRRDDETSASPLNEAKLLGWSARVVTAPGLTHSIELSCPFCAFGV